MLIQVNHPSYPSSLNQPRGLRNIRWSRWITGLLLALLVHTLLLLNPELFFPKSAPPPRVDLTDISPEKLDAIKRQWKSRPLLLNTDSTPPDPNAPAPKNARYDSDRNRTVEREQRARVTNVIPKPGSATGEDEAKAGKTGKAQRKALSLKDLSNFNLKGAGSRPQPSAEESEKSDSEERGQTQRGGDQAISDKDLPEGDRNILNTQEAKYYGFYSRIYETIGPLWQSLVRRTVSRKAFNAGEYLTRVEIVLDADGNYLEAHIIQSSGSRDLDEVIDEAWKKVPRFPNPPRDLLDSNGHIRMGWTFNVNLDQNTGLQYIPPSRNY
jgi:TonB family protein